MHLRFLSVITLLGLLFCGRSVYSAEVVVLVPGFFNSFAPEYFSHDIISSFTTKGFKVYVTQGLDPIGTIEANGYRLEKYLEKIEANEGHHVQFNIVAHSAGGLYTLWVANRQKLSIKNLYTISTPYQGIEFIQTWINDCFLFKSLTQFAYLEGFKQLTEKGVANFLNSIRLHPATKVIAFGGYQDASFDLTDARNISAPLRITSHFITTKSDGIVSFKSALGLGMLKTTAGTSALQYKVENLVFHLEHWEQVLDSQTFLILGVRNTSYIAEEQKRAYTQLAELLLKN